MIKSAREVGNNHVAFSFTKHMLQTKRLQDKNHEKHTVFHGFLLFKGQNQVFLESG